MRRFGRCVVLGLVALVGGGQLPVAVAADPIVVAGTAIYRERIALPPGAVFEVVVLDVSRADAPAVPIASYRRTDPGDPPFEFSIAVDPSRLEAKGRYGVRATITVDGRLRFTTGTFNPVLTTRAGDDVELLLIGVTADPAPASSAPREAVRGHYSIRAGAGWFKDCATGRALPIVPGQASGELQRRYEDIARGSGKPLLVSIEGEITPAPALIVHRVIATELGERCATPTAGAPLRGTYWRLRTVGDTAVVPVEGQVEAHLRLSADDLQFSGSGGCNRLTGLYTIEGDGLTFGEGAATVLLCPHGMGTERAFFAGLRTVKGWAVTGSHLELYDASGRLVARFEATREP